MRRSLERQRCYKAGLLSRSDGRIVIDFLRHRHPDTLILDTVFRVVQSLDPALFLSSRAATLVQASRSLPNIRATYGNSPAPFTIDVKPRFIDDIRHCVTNARSPISPGGYQSDYSEGPTLANISLCSGMAAEGISLHIGAWTRWRTTSTGGLAIGSSRGSVSSIDGL